MKFALLGYGKMGKEIEKLAEEKGHEIVLAIDLPEEWETGFAELNRADVAIDFSTPESVANNIHFCFDAGIPVVVGTTGWHEQIDEIRTECIERNQSLFWAPNFSIGVNIFFELNRKLASLMSNWPDYEISLEETHHIHKLDSPSGTAIVLANDIIRHHGRKEKWVKETTGHPGDLGIRSHRLEGVTGSHKVVYDSQEDQIEIIHTAKSRRGFALGAILAAEWLAGKTGFFEMKELLATQGSK
ncbi:MAG: 4-hydroxy-tetrahydrodipicolinate reductase [Bacteroidales bacterium]|nr:4-hydroxy-tetrahydrodipicolinate reductase [Bacteroidales bacterium]